MPTRKLTSVGGPLDFMFAEKELDLNGHPFKFRELSVAESDSILDASRLPDGGINGRLNMRMTIVKSAVEPKLTVDDLAKIPNRIYLKMAEFVNDLNSSDDTLIEPEEGEEDEPEGNE